MTAISEQLAILRAALTRTSQFSGEELGNLNSVQGSALAQIVARDEQRQPASVGHTRVATDPSDEGLVDTGGGQRRRHVNQLHPRSAGEDLAGTLGRKWLGEFGIDRQRVPGEHRDPHAGAADQQVRDTQDFAISLRSFWSSSVAGVVVDQFAGQRNDVERDRRDV